MSKKTTVKKATKKSKDEAKGKIEKPQPSPKIDVPKVDKAPVKTKSSPAPKVKIMSTEEIRKVIPPVGQPIPADLWAKLTLGQRAYWSWQRVIREKKAAKESKASK